jgi:two-component system CAI-1 autoinducer sensor kinase/phosphatase CqsS
MSSINALIRSARQRTQEIFEHSEPNMPALGLYAIVSYLLWGVVLIWFVPQPYENFGYRLTEAALALPLLLFRSLPPLLRRLFPFYFIFYTLFTCPLFFFIMSMKNEWSQVWTTTMLGGIMVVIVITYDWLFFILGMTLAYVTATLLVMAQDGVIRYTHLDATFVYSFIFSISGVMVATRWMRSYHEVRFTILKSMSGTIAHEMRNALNTVALSIESVIGLLPCKPLNGSESPVETPISNAAIVNIHESMAIGADTVQRTNKIITSILTSLSGRQIDQSNFRRLSAAESIHSVFENYGFASIEERSVVNIGNIADFEFLGDRDLFANLMTNLLNNALHYRHVKGFRIDVSTQILETGNRIIVRDTGPGIESDRLELVFRPFYTFGKPNGNGIGLAYCRHIVASFLGTIVCHSKIGAWTEFLIDLPAYNSRPVELLKQNILRNKRVLIVDDQPGNRSILSKFLGELHCMCEQAENGRIALEMASKTAYDLILMDIEMPEMNGDQATRLLRDGSGFDRVMAQHYVNVPIICVTALSREEGYRRSLESGMDECLFKPVRQTQLVGFVDKHLFTARSEIAEKSHEVMLGKRILIVEDNPVSRVLLKAMLETYGLSVLQAEDGRKALEILEKQSVDLMVMDNEMPIMNGMEASELIRSGGLSGELAHCSQIPIIMLTGYTDETHVAAARSAGINCHLGKPIQKAELVRAMTELLAAVKPGTESVTTEGTAVQRKKIDDIELLNLTVIDSLRELGDDAFMSNLIGMFISDTSSIIDELEDACLRNDHERVVRVNHTLKGSAASFGATKIVAISGMISGALRENSCLTMKGWVDDMRQACLETAEALSAVVPIDLTLNDSSLR